MVSNFYDPSSADYLDPKVNRKVVVITGANSGIGWFTALHLYIHGYVIYIIGRTESKVLSAIEEIKKEAQLRIKEIDHAVTPGELHFVYGDLVDLSTIVKAAEQLSKKEPKIDILINNAGLMGVPHEITKNGYEIQYQVNYVGHFLLTEKLLPNLKAVASAGGEPKVINISSVGHNFAYKQFDPHDTIDYFPNVIYTWVRYARAKASQIQFAREFAKKHPEILSVSVHPGLISGTEIYNHWIHKKYIGFFAKLSLEGVHKVIGITVEEGSSATLRVALDPSITASKDNGKYYQTGGSEGKPTAVVSSDANAKLVWDATWDSLHSKNFL